MDEELYCYVLRLPRLSDSPPRSDTPPGHVSWRDQDLKLSRFSGDSEALQSGTLLYRNPRSQQRAN